MVQQWASDTQCATKTHHTKQAGEEAQFTSTGLYHSI